MQYVIIISAAFVSTLYLLGMDHPTVCYLGLCGGLSLKDWAGLAQSITHIIFKLEIQGGFSCSYFSHFLDSKVHKVLYSKVQVTQKDRLILV